MGQLANQLRRKFFLFLLLTSLSTFAQNKPPTAGSNTDADLILYHNKSLSEFKLISNIDGTKVLDNLEELSRRGYSYCMVLFPDAYKSLGNPDAAQEILVNEIEEISNRLAGKRKIKASTVECISGDKFIGHNTANVVVVQRKAIPLLTNIKEFSNFEVFSEIKFENLAQALKYKQEALEKRAVEEKLWVAEIEKLSSSDNPEKLGSITLNNNFNKNEALKVCTTEYTGALYQAISVYGENIFSYTSPSFRKIAISNEATFNKSRPYAQIFKSIEVFYKEYQRDSNQCHVLVDYPKNLKLVMTAIERDKKTKAYEINSLINVADLRDTWAKKQGFNNLAELDFAGQIGATPKTLKTLTASGIADKAAYDLLISELRSSKYGDGNNLTEVLSYLEDKVLASKKNGATATSIKKEREAKLEKEAQIERDRLAEAQRIRNQPLSKASLNPKTEYVYYDDGSCKDDTNKRCLNVNQFKQICDFSNGFTKAIRSGLGVYYKGDYAEFLSTGGTLANTSYGWNGRTCVISFNVTGTFKGTTHDKKFIGVVSSFIVTDSKEVLIHYASFQ